MKVYFILAMTIVSVISMCSGQSPHLTSPQSTEFCLKELNWDEEQLKSILTKGPVRDITCWMSCLYHRVGKMSKNKLSKPWIKRAQKVKLMEQQLEYECIMEAHNIEDTCEAVNSYLECLQLNLHDLEAQITYVIEKTNELNAQSQSSMWKV